MEEKNQQNGIRINKFLSEAGVCSRRAADPGKLKPEM